MQTFQMRDSVLPNQQIFINAGNNKLNINDKNFYCIIRDCYEKLNKKDNLELIETLPTQSNIYTIQKAYLDLIETKQDINIAGVKINFADDEWNFTSKCKAGKRRSLYTYNFSSVELSDYQKTVLKLYVFYNITEFGLHCGSNKNYFSEIRNIMEYMNSRNIVLIEDLTLNDFQEYFKQLNIKYTTKIKKRRRLKSFLMFYSLIATDVFTKEISNWFNDIDTDAIKADIENHKAPLLPASFYKKYTSLLYSSVTNEKNDKFKRGYHGLLYIGTQTGLRASELTLLRVQDLEVCRFKNKQIGILHYRSTKSGNGKSQIYDDAQTNANKKVIEVYEILSSIFTEEREKLNTDFLVPRNIEASHYNNPPSTWTQVLPRALNHSSAKLCLENIEDLNLLNSPEAHSFEGNIIYKGKRINGICPKSFAEAGVKEGDMICLPTIRQFRVYVASELRERGVDDRTTAFLFNHHCVEMYGYYARPKHDIQEDIDFSKEIVKDIVRDKTKILGPKGDAFNEKINRIIEENNFNVKKDLNAIIDKVCNEIPIRAKNGGFCIKSNPRRECRHDAKTDEFMCAYGCCPNHCHMYFMLAITYKKVQTLIKTYEYNLKSGFKNASEKEAYKLNYAIINELLPEIKETRKEIQLRGVEAIVQAHSEMKSIINDIDKIEQEALQWKSKLEKIE